MFQMLYIYILHFSYMYTYACMHACIYTYMAQCRVAPPEMVMIPIVKRCIHMYGSRNHAYIWRQFMGAGPWTQDAGSYIAQYTYLHIHSTYTNSHIYIYIYSMHTCLHMYVKTYLQKYLHASKHIYTHIYIVHSYIFTAQPCIFT